jgi:formylglycine-generating enzyme required for sulfatase activity
MKPMKSITAVTALGLALGMMASAGAQSTTTETFGSGANTFSLDFVTVGNPGNANDTGAGGGSYGSPYGAVDYVYRISTHAISQNNITTATAAGLANVTAGQHTGHKPAADISWFEAAAFVNWLNTSRGHQAAYNLTWNGSAWSMTLWSSSEAWQTGGENLYRHKDAHYFLPSEDEWYKAAYHQNNGVTADYWDYATGSDTVPTPVTGGTASGSAVYNQLFATGPADVHLSGGLSPYGTMGQNGNVWEWSESAFDGSNNVTTALRALRGGNWFFTEIVLRSSFRSSNDPTDERDSFGFRVASVPEP